MIPGFEDYTAELSQDEFDALPHLISIMRPMKGKKNAVTNQQIGYMLQAKTGLDFKPARIRKIMNVLRRSGQCEPIIASSSGYWIAGNESELHEYLESLQTRIDSIQALHDALKGQNEESDVQGELFKS